MGVLGDAVDGQLRGYVLNPGLLDCSCSRDVLKHRGIGDVIDGYADGESVGVDCDFEGKHDNVVTFKF